MARLAVVEAPRFYEQVLGQTMRWVTPGRCAVEEPAVGGRGMGSIGVLDSGRS